MEFYERVIGTLIKDGAVSKTDKVLVVCGWIFDRDILHRLGLQNVTISNLDHRYDERLKPYEWAREDAENLSFKDGSFDWVFVHAGLHHCASPHRALLEMLRVARKGAMAVEARESLLMKAALAFGLTDAHEISAPVTNEFKYGGLRDGPIPNYIYRWTEHEVYKTVESAYPGRCNDIRFFYGLRSPLLAFRNPVMRVAGLLGYAISKAVHFIAPKQCNSFAFAITHTTKLKPWMREDGSVKRDWH